ncbi:MAG: response regulator transcription factor [Rhodospirillales bacterium]|nr:response regulator transcription factor [Rhodospirillales bacterium]
MNGASHILIVEDDLFVQSLLAAFLEKEGFRASRASSGKEMLAMLDQVPVDLVLLDLNLPDEDGLTLARLIRARSRLPIVVLTAREGRDSRLAALEIGADDYLVKPFDPEELALRLRNLLSRTKGGGLAERQGADSKAVRFEGFTLDLANRSLTAPDGQAIALSPGEYNLMAALARAPGRVLSRGHLLDAVSRSEESPTERLIDVLVSRLRKKTNRRDLIATVPGLGYRFGARLDV